MLLSINMYKPATHIAITAETEMQHHSQHQNQFNSKLTIVLRKRDFVMHPLNFINRVSRCQYNSHYII